MTVTKFPLGPNTLRVGSGAPSNGAGANGDMYLRTDTYVLIGPKASDAWPGSGTSLVGPQGVQGTAGSQGSPGTPGAAGADGRTIYNGSNAPSDSNGANGDLYLRTDNTTIYVKASGTWGSATSLIGPQGTAGSAGTPGAAGNTVLSGASDPVAGNGVNGDYFINTTTKVMFGPKASGAWPSTGTPLGGNGSPTQGVIWTSATQTWSASGSTATFTTPSTVNGQTVSKLIITDIVVRLLSGTPGTSATFGLTIGGNLCFSSRQLPTFGGGIDVTVMNLNVQSLSGTIKAASPGDSIVVTSGGTFSGSTTWQIDLIGYYVGLSQNLSTNPGGATYQGTADPTGAIGNNGDTYFQSTSGTMWLRSAGTWALTQTLRALNIVSFSGTASAIASGSDITLVNTSSGGTVNLPSAPTLPTRICVANQAGGTITVAQPASATIKLAGSTTIAGTTGYAQVLDGGSALTLVNYGGGSNSWTATIATGNVALNI